MPESILIVEDEPALRDTLSYRLVIAFLFCVGKLAVKHKIMTPCYPMGMEMFLTC